MSERQEESVEAQIYNAILQREEHFRSALGTQRDFGQWWAAAKTWLAVKLRDTKWQPYAKFSITEIVSAYTSAAVLGLLVDGEECMVMIRGQKRPQIKCEICAKGVVRKAGQAGWTINARTVKEGDYCEIDEGTGTVTHKPAWLSGQEPGETRGYYAVAKKRDGTQVVRGISFDDAQRRKQPKSDAWDKWPDPMGEKTAVLTLRKVLYLGDELEDLMKSAGVVTEQTWEDPPPADEGPAHPPQSLSDRVATAAAKQMQDDAAESTEPAPDDEPTVEPGEDDLSQEEPKALI